MKWVGNIPAGESTAYTSKGCFIGRPHPNPSSGKSVDDLEKEGLVGVYEQDFYIISQKPQLQPVDAIKDIKSVTVDVDLELDKFQEALKQIDVGKIIKSVDLPKIKDAKLNSMPVTGIFRYDIKDNPLKEAPSNLDDRIKECKKEQNNPKKYRTRWNGVRYVYERTDE